MTKLVINKCFGGFGLSDAAYEHLIKQGIPVRAYIQEKRDPETMRFMREPDNEGEVIFDRTLTPENLFCDEQHIRLIGRYWETWLGGKRDDPRLIAAVESLVEKANGVHAKLVVVEIPDGIEWGIHEYDGMEHVEETHRTWG